MKTKMQVKEKTTMHQTTNGLVFVDVFGAVRKELKELEKKEEALKEKMQSWDVGDYEGKKFILTIQEVVTPVLDAEAVLKTIGLKKFLEVVTISTDKLRDYMSVPEIEKCTKSIKTYKRFLVKEKK